MRIAYVAHYQGPTLVKKRPCLDNLSLAIRVKVQLIAELLRKNSHEVEIISPGEADRYECRFYPFLEEEERFDPSIPIFYASALPIRFINGFWSGNRSAQLFKARHKLSPFDAVIVHNMKPGHIACAKYADRCLGLPVILEYEDDVFANVRGEIPNGWLASYHRSVYTKMLKRMSGCMAVSPYLLSQLPCSVPKLLLRGVVSDKIIKLNGHPASSRPNWVVFSGTHEGTQGLEQLVQAWNMLALPDWELHVAGRGPITSRLQSLAGGNRSIVFHGFLNQEQNAELLCRAKIGMNAQDVTKVPGNVFAFKIIEYLAAGLHVITTPRGPVESELEEGITYIMDNVAETIAKGLKEVIDGQRFERTAQRAAVERYGPDAIGTGLNRLVEEAKALNIQRHAGNGATGN